MRPWGRRPADTSGHVECGCCGRRLPRSSVHELGGAPGVFLCRRCALWIATRINHRQPPVNDPADKPTEPAP